MFIVFFAIFTFIFTVFENIFIWLIVFFIILFGILLWKKVWIQQKKTLTGFLILSFTLTFLATSRKQFDYFSDTPKSFLQINSWQIIYQQKSSPQLLFYAGTGQVVDTNSQWKYIFEDGHWNQYFLNTKKVYEIWNTVFLNGYIQPWRTDLKLIYKLKEQSSQFKNILNSFSLSWLFHYEFDYKTWLMMKWYYGTINEQNSIKFENVNIWIISEFRKNLQKNVIEIYGKNRVSGLILWMLIGDKSQIPKADYQWFIDSWLVHLIAVSWGNIIMIVVFLWMVLIFLPFYVRNFVILCFIIFYALICGLDSSVFRAVIMGSLGMIALFWWKEINIWRSMSISFIFMLLINPYFLAYDVWFLLSFGAIIGILYLQQSNNTELNDKKTEKLKNGKIEKCNDKQKISISFFKTRFWKIIAYFFENYIKPTIWATLGIFPLIIFFMWKINLVSIVWNFFVLPIVPFVMIYGFVSVRAYQLLQWKWIIWIEELLVNYIYKISEMIWQKWLYLMVAWDRIKYLILIFSIVIFVVFKLLNEKKESSK